MPAMTNRGDSKSFSKKPAEVGSLDEQSGERYTNSSNATAALIAVIRRSLDDAFRRAGVPVAPPKEQLIVEQVTQEVSVEIERTVSNFYRGPMPPPTMMREFEEVLPGLAREIADASHAERKHRHAWENKALWNDIFVESGGLFLGWALAGGCAISAALLAWKSNNWGAAIMLSAPLVAMVRTIVNGNRNTADGGNIRPSEAATSKSATRKARRN
jgi:hypothetical protein